MRKKLLAMISISYVAFVLTLVLGATSACLSHFKAWRHEERAVPNTELKAAVVSARPPMPTGFDRVQLFDRNHWVVAEPSRVLRTEDSGRTWIISYEIQTKTVHDFPIRGLSFVNREVGFLVVNDVLLRTSDGGKTWEEIGTIKQRDTNIRVNNCYFADALHGWVVGFVFSAGYGGNDPKVPAYVGIVFTTDDGGRTWRQQQLETSVSQGMRWALNGVFFKDATTGWIVADAGVIFWTNNGGEKFNLARAENVDYKSVTFLDDHFGWATYRYGNSSWGVAVSDDAGRHWKLLSESLAFGTWNVDAVFLTPEHGFAISRTLYETLDGGRKWISVSERGADDGSEFSYLGRAQDGTLVAFGTKDNRFLILTSGDGGRTWQSSI